MRRSTVRRTGAVRRYGLAAYLAGATTARTADEMSSPALLLLGLAVTGSARTASALYAGLTISAAAGGPVLGALLDRSARPGRLLAVALAGYAAGLAMIAVTVGRTPASRSCSAGWSWSSSSSRAAGLRAGHRGSCRDRGIGFA